MSGPAYQFRVAIQGGLLSSKQRIRQQRLIPKNLTKSCVQVSMRGNRAKRLADALGAAFNERLKMLLVVSREISGCVQLLPHVFDSCVITTNFDSVTKRCYERLQESHSRRSCRGNIREIFQGNLLRAKRVLLKLHGTSTTPRGRILTAAEYQTLWRWQ